MKNILIILIGLTIYLTPPSQAGMSEYNLGSGDEISIQVFNEEDLTLNTVLSDTGTISYPLLGELPVLGLTTGELENTITMGLKNDYLIDPRVYVSIVKYRLFYVTGEVKKAGGFPFSPGISVRQAISLAGGFTDRAAHKKIFIISDNLDKEKSHKVNKSTAVKAGDIITVEQSFF